MSLKEESTEPRDVEQTNALGLVDGSRHSTSGDSDMDDSSSSSSSSSSESSETASLDGGWGWMVVLASFVAHVIADGCCYSAGVLLVEWLEVFEESKAKTSWIPALFVSMHAIFGPSLIIYSDFYKFSIRIFTFVILCHWHYCDTWLITECLNVACFLSALCIRTGCEGASYSVHHLQST